MASRLQLTMSYEPKVNDYVKWKNHEGWVYFKDDSHITIEIGTKDKKYPVRTRSAVHYKDHVLIVCNRYNWNELVYVRSRKSKYEN